jgi:hypothetical protein
MDAAINSPAKTQRCKKKVVSKIKNATPQQIDALQHALRASFTPVSAAIKCLPRDQDGTNQKLEAMLDWWQVWAGSARQTHWTH